MKKSKLSKFITLLIVAVSTITLVINTYAATGSKPAGEYGTLNANNNIGVNDFEKIVSLNVSTTAKAAEKYIIKYNIVYAETGKSITGDVELININMLSPMRSYEDVEMHHWKNAVTGKADGFRNTEIKAYSTHEVRGDYSYVIYLSEKL